MRLASPISEGRPPSSTEPTAPTALPTTRRAKAGVPRALCLLGVLGALGALATLGALGCEEPTSAPEPVVVTQELTLGWELLPHRISELELALRREGPSDGFVVARNAGGTFGVMDTPYVRYGFVSWRSRALVSARGSVTIPIPPGSAVGGEPFSAEAPLTLTSRALASAGGLVAFVEGYRIGSDDYASRPAFEAEIPYDPADGYTSQGYGIALGEPAAAGDQVTVPVRVRNTLGPCDRADMNAAIPLATTWMRVDVVVVGVKGPHAVTREQVAYTLSTPDYGRQTVHPHAPEAEQELSFQGEAGLSQALFGITAFDLWVNLPGHQDPECVVVEDATNFEGLPISGPGRYLTSMTVRLWDRAYEPDSGHGSAKLDLHLSNRSAYKEEGNLCAGFAGEVGMLQWSDPEARSYAPPPVEIDFSPEEPQERAVPLWPPDE